MPCGEGFISCSVAGPDKGALLLLLLLLSLASSDDGCEGLATLTVSAAMAATNRAVVGDDG